ncbi:retroviral-like aspartic protease family protein [Undibacterium baiyunense]|uniref:Retroviral-like aspartic protease family protein n=1 Tax=Undibacterium baiyunense TaxID=2828731 RepID=A0A941DE88_9BURK|nr:retroviral-like aspartic protease family protein [Undibacterium baiyunense]MBR7746386.1 retroviral-like aspartic protease family protein [Undibacterium baiyunense]
MAVVLSRYCGATELNCEYKNLSIIPIQFSGSSLLPTIEGKINQKAATMLLDTGSGLTYLMPATAENLNLRVGKPTSVAYGVGGVASRSVTRPDSFEIGAIRSNRPYLFVLNRMGFTPYFDAIVGVDYLLALDMEVDFQAKQVKLYKAKDCTTYPRPDWATNEVAFLDVDKDDDRPQFRISLNGKLMRAIVDTAAKYTTMSLKVAENLGITESSGRLLSPQFAVGVGEGKSQTWKTTIDQIEIGDVIWRNKEVSVGNLAGGDEKAPEIILGKDFLLEHRILFSMGSRRLYLSPFKDLSKGQTD